MAQQRETWRGGTMAISQGSGSGTDHTSDAHRIHPFPTIPLNRNKKNVHPGVFTHVQPNPDGKRELGTNGSNTEEVWLLPRNLLDESLDVDSAGV